MRIIAIVFVIINILIYSFIIKKLRERGEEGLSLFGKSDREKSKKKLRPVMPEPESSATWNEDFEEDLGKFEKDIEEEIGRYWEKEPEERPEKEGRFEEEEPPQREESEEDVRARVTDEERRVKLLWKNYVQKLDKFIEKLEKGNPSKYFEYYKEYENLDKFYSRFVFNFGLYLDEIEKNKASGRLGYCSTLLKEMLKEM